MLSGGDGDSNTGERLAAVVVDGAGVPSRSDVLCAGLSNDAGTALESSFCSSVSGGGQGIMFSRGGALWKGKHCSQCLWIVDSSSVGVLPVLQAGNAVLKLIAAVVPIT